MILKTEKTLKVHVIWERTQELFILICEEASTTIKKSSDFPAFLLDPSEVQFIFSVFFFSLSVININKFSGLYILPFKPRNNAFKVVTLHSRRRYSHSIGFSVINAVARGGAGAVPKK